MKKEGGGEKKFAPIFPICFLFLIQPAFLPLSYTFHVRTSIAEPRSYLGGRKKSLKKEKEGSEQERRWRKVALFPHSFLPTQVISSHPFGSIFYSFVLCSCGVLFFWRKKLFFWKSKFNQNQRSQYFQKLANGLYLCAPSFSGVREEKGAKKFDGTSNLSEVIKSNQHPRQNQTKSNIQASSSA